MNEQSEKFLKVRKKAEELRKLYNEDPRNASFNALVLGESGSGKTFLLRTCRKPVHVDVFDPGGAKGLHDLIEKGEVIADTRYGNEDPRRPTAFKAWMAEMRERAKMNYFEHLGTYCIDSSTTWADAIMHNILLAAGIAGESPRWSSDYVPQKTTIRNWLGELLSLPCDFILTGHLEASTDEVTGRTSFRYMTTGKAAVTIPLLFDEIYIMDPKKTSSGVEYRILTKSTGIHIARSRLAKNNLLDMYEEADIKKILKKAGMPTEDKPSLF